MPILMKRFKHSVRRKVTTVMQDKKIGAILKKKKQDILKSILAEYNGLLIIHSIDRNAEQIQKLINMQAEIQEQVSSLA